MPFEVVTDRELERALLASLLADNSGFDRLCGLEPDDFSDPIWAGLLSAMLDLREDGRAVNFITLRSRCLRIFLACCVMSAFGGKADIRDGGSNVCF